MSENETPAVSPLNYVKILFRRKEFITIPAILGLVLGICAGLLMPKEYRSSTVLLVEEGKTDNPLFSQIAVSTTVQQRISTIRESMLGWNSLVKLVKRLGMDQQAQTAREFERLVLGIRDRIKISMRGHNIIDLSFNDEDPQLAKNVVESITNIFIERNLEIQNQDTSDAVDFIAEQLKVYRGKIKSAEIAQLKEHLNVLLVDSTEKHPRVRELREQIGARQEELEKEQLEYTEDVSLDASTTNPLIEEIRRSLNQIETSAGGSGAVGEGKDDDIYKVMLMDKLENVVARDVNVNNEIYNMLLNRLETAKITQRLQASKEGTRYTVLDPPRMPLKPFKPNIPLVSFLGLIAGGGLGITLVFLVEFLDKSFIDVEDANQFFGTPLLGAISKIATEDGVRKERERMVWIYSLLLVVSFMLVIGAQAAATFLN